MHGIGNDFVMIDRLSVPLKDESMAGLAVALCDRTFGIGADGVITLEKGASLPLAMQMWNPDGSESEMCGNGVRCFARFAAEKGHTSGHLLSVETGAGPLTLKTTDDGLVSVEMGRARGTRGEIGMTGDPTARVQDEKFEVDGHCFRGTAVSMGNPHLVFFVPDVESIDLEKLGPLFEHHPDFPERVNVHFVQIASCDHLIQRTWERGAGATLACGTGACASVVAAYWNGLSGPDVRVSLPGGELTINVSAEGDVTMTGPAEKSFEGHWRGDVSA